MIRISPKDLIMIESEGVYYYSLIIDKIKLFGGQLSYVFYHSSKKPDDPQIVLEKNVDGFLAVVDYIWAKREDRMTRLLKNVDIARFEGPGFFKNTHSYSDKAPKWWIYDKNGRELETVLELSAHQKSYPLLSRIDDIIMTKRIREKWSILNDPRI